MNRTVPGVLGLLIKHELAIKSLYETFAAVFEKYSDFWLHLAADEQNHANWLEALSSRPAYGNWFLRQSLLRPQAIELSIGYVENQITRTRKGGLTLLEALSIAKDLENALLEKQFSKISGSAPAEIRPILSDLARETEKHRDSLLRALDQQQRFSP